MHARHRWLVDTMTPEMVERLRGDEEFYDAKVAGYWVWGASCWIGSGWCDGVDVAHQKRPQLAGQGGGDGRTDTGRGNRASLSRQLPRLHGAGTRQRRNGKEVTEQRATRGAGIHRDEISTTRLPHLQGPANGNKPTGNGEGVGYGRGIFASGRREDLLGYFRLLADRFSLVRITCGDWSRVCTPAVTTSHGLTGVLLDPPYPSKDRATVYAEDSREVAHDVAAWAREQGEDPRMRIVLCGYSGEHDMPGWREVAWKSRGGYGRGKNANATRERLWLSPHCLAGHETQGSLFVQAGATT